MDYLKAEELRQSWGNKPCDHPSFEKETHKDSEGIDIWDGTDYDCTQCGANFTKKELEEWHKNHGK